VKKLGPQSHKSVKYLSNMIITFWPMSGRDGVHIGTRCLISSGTFKLKPVRLCLVLVSGRVLWTSQADVMSHVCVISGEQERRLKNGEESSISSQRLSKLEDLFRPPLDIIHHGSFESVSL